jgi:hypothetical protein
MNTHVYTDDYLYVGSARIRSNRIDIEVRELIPTAGGDWKKPLGSAPEAGGHSITLPLTEVRLIEWR